MKTTITLSLLFLLTNLCIAKKCPKHKPCAELAKARIEVINHQKNRINKILKGSLPDNKKYRLLVYSLKVKNEIRVKARLQLLF